MVFYNSHPSNHSKQEEMRSSPWGEDKLSQTMFFSLLSMNQKVIKVPSISGSEVMLGQMGLKFCRESLTGSNNFKERIQIPGTQITQKIPASDASLCL